MFTPEAERAHAAEQALHQVADGLGAETAVVWLSTPRGRLDMWALSGRHAETWHVAGLHPRSMPTVRRVMNERGLHLVGCRNAPDIADTCRRVGCSGSGAFLLEPIGAPPAIGALLAGRSAGDWSAVDRDELRTVARHAANRLHVGPTGVVPIARSERRLELGASADAVLTAITGSGSWLRRRAWIRAGRQSVGTAGELTPSVGARATGARSVSSTGPQVLAASLEPHTAGTPRSDTPASAGPAAAGTRLPGPPGSAVRAAGSARTAEGPAAVSASVPTSEPPEEGELAPAPSGHAAADRRAPSAEALARLRAYELAVEQFPWGILLVDASDRIVAGNRAAADLLHTDVLVPGRPVAEAFPDPPRALYAFRSLAEDARDDAGQQHVLFEASRLRLELHPLRHPVVGYVGAIGLVYRQTTVAASSAAHLLPEIAAALKAPMSSIVGYSEVLRRGGVRDEQVDHVLGRIDANLSRLRIMLGNLVTAVRHDGDAARLTGGPVSVDEALRGSLERVAPQLSEKGAELAVSVDNPLPPASADAQALAIVLDNLLMNAARRSPQGARIQVTASVRDESGAYRGIVIAVSDEGPPLAGGLGLMELDSGGADCAGMAVARLLAERQGARAWAESHPMGTRFCIRLPVRRGRP